MNEILKNDELYLYDTRNQIIVKKNVEDLKYYSDSGCYLNMENDDNNYWSYYNSIYKLFCIYNTNSDSLIYLAHKDRATLKENLKKYFVHKAEFYIEQLRDIDNE